MNKMSAFEKFLYILVNEKMTIGEIEDVLRRSYNDEDTFNKYVFDYVQHILNVLETDHECQRCNDNYDEDDVFFQLKDCDCCVDSGIISKEQAAECNKDFLKEAMDMIDDLKKNGVLTDTIVNEINSDVIELNKKID